MKRRVDQPCVAPEHHASATALGILTVDTPVHQQLSPLLPRSPLLSFHRSTPFPTARFALPVLPTAAALPLNASNDDVYDSGHVFEDCQYDGNRVPTTREIIDSFLSCSLSECVSQGWLFDAILKTPDN